MNRSRAKRWKPLRRMRWAHCSQDTFYRQRKMALEPPSQMKKRPTVPPYSAPKLVTPWTVKSATRAMPTCRWRRPSERASIVRNNSEALAALVGATEELRRRQQRELQDFYAAEASARQTALLD
jgi:hypothetical protein